MKEKKASVNGIDWDLANHMMENAVREAQRKYSRV